jgi:class 3 adenylate cyclase/predicted ATPase
MTFEEILDQAIAMLQRRGRVSYRALQRQFQLDDAYLQDLTAEIVEVLQLAVDQDHTLLVWTGGPSAPAPVSPPPPQMSPPDAQEPHPTPYAPAPSVQHAPEAERRQLTVMFIDLVESTSLSSQLDPEEYREVIRAYQRVCTDVIQRYDGHIAQLLGDGLLVYFGYPQAHEDDAQRAVRTGLGILAAMDDLHTRLLPVQGRTLAVRLGIHTGLVVIGALGDQGRPEHLALGETPNLAARIQGLAAPNSIAISDASYRLVQGYFVCQDLGAQALRGVTEAMRVYHVLGESGATSRLEVAQPRGLTPLVGREQEVGVLIERWEQVKAGHGHMVLLTGEGGIGKSRLVQVLKDHVANEPHVHLECRSVPYYQNTALYPLTDLFQRTLQWRPDETPEEKCSKLEQALSQYKLPVEETVPLFAPLLALPISEHRYPSLNLSPQRQRQKTLETIVALLLELAEHQPVLFIVEDVHWTDPTTLELLNLVLDQTPTASMLVLLTCRPPFQPAWHHRSYITEMTLNHLSHSQVEEIVHRMTAGKTLPPEVLQQIMTKTDGVPLFIEEITKAILESGHLKETDGHYALTGSFSTLAIPATLQDSLMARLDRLVTAKAVAQYAAVIGRQFAYDVLSTVSQLDASTLQRELGRLVEAEIVYQRGVPPQATFTFKHALIQDAAYASLLKSTRQQYHQRIAHVLETQFPETAEAQPELLAHHYTEAGLTEQAVAFWQRAGQQARQRSANQEAVQHLEHGLALLAGLPETPLRAQRELDLQIALGPAVMAVKGSAAPEVEQIYARARVLCQHVGETPQLLPTLWGLSRFYGNRGAYATARELTEQLYRLAQREATPTPRLEAHAALVAIVFSQGEYALARTHAEQGIALADPRGQRAMAFRYDVVPGVICLECAAQALWCLGYPRQALRRSQEALALAQELAHPLSLALTQHWATWLHYRRGEVLAVHAQAETLLTLASAQGFPLYVGHGTYWRGWALARQGQGEAGLAQMHQGLAALLATGHEAARPRYLVLLAEVARQVGEVEEGLRLLAEALTAFEAGGQGDLLAEAHRLQGDLLLRHRAPDAAQAEACFQQALAIARRQQAKSWELRAAISLARLWQQQGKCQEAHDLLAPVYGWFTEGFDTADLQEAKALLEELA